MMIGIFKHADSVKFLFQLIFQTKTETKDYYVNLIIFRFSDFRIYLQGKIQKFITIFMK